MPEDLAKRRECRRRALLDAGIRLLGAEGHASLNVRTVCRSTGVTERYFYELFGTRDRYVRAVYDDVSGQARDALAQASAGARDFRAAATAAVGAFVELMIDRPDMGRVLLMAPWRDPALSNAVPTHLPDFHTVVADAVPATIGDQVRQLVAVEIVGALTGLFTQFLSGALAVGRDQLVEHCVEMIVAAIERVSSD